LELKRAIEEIKSNTKYQIRAETLKEKYSDLGGSEKACELVSRLL